MLCQVAVCVVYGILTGPCSAVQKCSTVTNKHTQAHACTHPTQAHTHHENTMNNVQYIVLPYSYNVVDFCGDAAPKLKTGDLFVSFFSLLLVFWGHTNYWRVDYNLSVYRLEVMIQLMIVSCFTLKSQLAESLSLSFFLLSVYVCVCVCACALGPIMV